MTRLASIALTLAFVLTLGVAAPASARAAATLCTDILSATTITGDLVVPEGVYCELDGSTVLGDVLVHRRSTFAAYDSTITGRLRATDFGLVLLERSRLGGQLQLSNGISGWFEQATLEGGARLYGVSDTRLLHTTVQNNLVVRDAHGQVQFCGSSVTGNARFAGNEGFIQIGGEPASCAANEVRGSLRVHHNRQEITVANTRVGQNLICAANEPAPTVFGNQVGGKARGQCGLNELVDPAELSEAE